MPARMPLGRSRAFPDQRRETIEQPHHVGRVAQGVPARDAELQRADALERPADVAGGQTAVDEAVQRVGVVQPGAGKFELDAGEEFPVAAQPAKARDLRVRAVGADQVAGAKRPVDDPAGRLARQRRQRHAPAEDDAHAHRLRDHPAQQAGRVGGDEVVAGSLQADVAQRRRVHANRRNRPRQRRRHRPQPADPGHLANEQARRVEARSGMRLAIDDADPLPGQRRLPRARDAGEARARRTGCRVG